MSRAAVQFLRDSSGGWKPVGVWLGSRSALMSRFDPAVRMHDYVRTIHDYARPPAREEGGPPGTWEDWIEYALDALSNGHDLHIMEVQPEITVDELYAREVLKLPPSRRKGYALAGIPNVTTIELPDLDGREGRA